MNLFGVLCNFLELFTVHSVRVDSSPFECNQIGYRQYRRHQNWRRTMSTKKTRTPNDQRSDALNSNSPENKAARDNRSRQLNPQDPKFGGGKKEDK